MGDRVVSAIVMFGPNIDAVMDSFWSCLLETLEN